MDEFYDENYFKFSDEQIEKLYSLLLDARALLNEENKSSVRITLIYLFVRY